MSSRAHYASIILSRLYMKTQFSNNGESCGRLYYFILFCFLKASTSLTCIANSRGRSNKFLFARLLRKSYASLCCVAVLVYEIGSIVTNSLLPSVTMKGNSLQLFMLCATWENNIRLSTQYCSGHKTLISSQGLTTSFFEFINGPS